MLHLWARQKKSDRLLKVGKGKGNTDFREVTPDYTNLLPQMSKEINLSFNNTYHRTLTSNLSSKRNDIINAISLIINLIQIRTRVILI